MITIVSGGQTGVDLGALDAALEAQAPCGGWCPTGRINELGVIPEHYPLKELKKGGYFLRTVQNIIDSDGTLILYFGEIEGGTEETLFRCIKQKRPYQLIDAQETSEDRSIQLVLSFVKRHRIARLNVAGPRGSKWSGGHRFARQVISGTLASLADEDETES
ncbi:MAG: putative molybdenum carrier protein [Verrucomicrobiota bacterium]